MIGFGSFFVKLSVCSAFSAGLAARGPIGCCAGGCAGFGDGEAVSVSRIAVGDVVEATIVSVTSFGAFARITDGIDGLIHISQLSAERVTNVKDVVNVGDTVTVKITAIDTEKKRISLSMRAASEDADEEIADEADEVVYSDEAPAAETEETPAE